MSGEVLGPPPGNCDVAVIGGGPAGLAVATELKKLGVSNVVVLEREAVAGGIPRHCGHPPFGMREFRRCYTGPAYARRLVERAVDYGVKLSLRTTVVKAGADCTLTLSTPAGASELVARKTVLCTGVRETPRSARFVSGQRPHGITTTGALQSMVYLNREQPFTKPVIVGTELVSFSALLTCRHAGIEPVAMLETNQRPTAWRGSDLVPRLMGVRLRLNTQVTEILGRERVEGVDTLAASGSSELIQCDGIVFSGQFIPEATLIRMGHLTLDPMSGGPVIDQFGRCSDPDYFAAGNLLRPVETAGWCWREGSKTAQFVYASLTGELPAAVPAVTVVASHPIIKYVVPGKLAVPVRQLNLQLRFTATARGRLSLRCGARVLYQKRINTLPERRMLLPVPDLHDFDHAQTLSVCFEPG